MEFSNGLSTDEAVLSCTPWGAGVTWFTLKVPRGGQDRWFLFVQPSTEKVDGSELLPGNFSPEPRPARVLLRTEDTQWGTWDAAEAVPGLVVDGLRAELDVELASVDGGGSPGPVRIQGWMRCPDLEVPSEVPDALVDLLHRATGAEVRRWSTFEFGRLKDHRAISSKVIANGLDEAVAKIRQALPDGWTAFVGAQDLVGELPDFRWESEIVLAPGGSMEDILRVAHVSAVNYDMDTEDVIAQLRDWSQRYGGVNVLRARTDSVRFVLGDLPDEEVGRFAEEVYEFCPDIVDQGVGTMKALEAEIRSNGGGLDLWWD